MQTITSLLIEKDPLTFLILTVMIGGGVAYISGRAIAVTWRPRWQLLFYMMLLGGVLRFFHWSLFEGTLLSLYFYMIDVLVLLIGAALGHQISRMRQMAKHYYWLSSR